MFLRHFSNRLHLVPELASVWHSELQNFILKGMNFQQRFLHPNTIFLTQTNFTLRNPNVNCNHWSFCFGVWWAEKTEQFTTTFNLPTLKYGSGDSWGRGVKSSIARSRFFYFQRRTIEKFSGTARDLAWRKIMKMITFQQQNLVSILNHFKVG